MLDSITHYQSQLDVSHEERGKRLKIRIEAVPSTQYGDYCEWLFNIYEKFHENYLAAN